MKPSYEDLEDEVRVLQQRVAELSGAVAAERIRRFIRLAPKEAQTLAFLHGREIASKGMIYSAVFETERGEGPWIGSVPVAVCRLRKTLQANGVPGQIVTIGRAGYEMTQPMRSWLSERLAA